MKSSVVGQHNNLQINERILELRNTTSELLWWVAVINLMCRLQAMQERNCSHSGYVILA
jgi:hypothetical protein